ncbi:MAG: DNA repair protein RecN [Burkholderiales bacterium RIFOXYC12_FULL_65_23]|uniref:DNA repair protein RecN n=1 Tax=Malikia spinosa TaxID=86180 RepID=UPI0008B3DD37|nr:DNA repair protein RecN [Malikia spinosa]OGB70730.1 MAG: DNA repair protein RecN [Burkholderiales bacterium RIFOXYC12_FULL_65_23]
MSLRRMSLRDFVIVRALDLELETGFTVLTGETGAGKSILIDALQFALGARADAGVVREGAPRCEIAAEFDLSELARQWLDENGFAIEPGEALLLKRSLDSQGRSRAWINGSAATVAQLKALAEELVDIHGQHAWQSLTRPDAVRQLLDDYGRISSSELRGLWADWRQALQALEQARQQQATLQQERERLQWQLGELAKLAPASGEWDELNLQHGRLAHAQGLMDAARSALQALDEEEGGATQLLHRALQALQEQQHIEPRYGEIAAVLQSALAQVEDACHDLQHHADPTELDPGALELLDQRLAQWLSLARRFRCQPEELPERLAQWQRQLAELDRSSDLDALQLAERRAQQALLKAASKVSTAREQAAVQLSQAITAAMQGLGMAGGRFEARLVPLPEPQAHGMENVEFLVAGHPGSTPRPVGKVASGGELSRIALAISVTTSQLGQAPTLIFDEVDSGIGGAVAQTVGRLMRQLGQDRQVLAVTHLPQVAASADHHLFVSKRQDDQGTASEVRAIADETRVQELARMLGGDKLSDASLAHAREMLLP